MNNTAHLRSDQNGQGHTVLISFSDCIINSAVSLLIVFLVKAAAPSRTAFSMINKALPVNIQYSIRQKCQRPRYFRV